MTASYREIGRRIVEFEQGGKGRAKYGEALIERLAADLTRRFGRGFSADNLELMRLFYQVYPPRDICQTLSRKFAATVLPPNSETPSPNFTLEQLTALLIGRALQSNGPAE